MVIYLIKECSGVYEDYIETIVYCTTNKDKVELAKKCEIKISEPMTVCEFLRSEKTISNKPMSVLIDEMDSVLSSLLSQAFNVNVEAVTITTDKEIV